MRGNRASMQISPPPASAAFSHSPSPSSSISSPSRPLRQSTRPGTRQRRCAEVAGGTAASCAAVCCCCPCALVDLLVLAVVRVPAGLCRKAIRKRRLARKPTVCPTAARTPLHDDSSPSLTGAKAADAVPDGAGNVVPDEMKLMEEEMWQRFNGAGFWRSPSQRDQ